MKDISIYFQPVERVNSIDESLGNKIQYHTDGDFPSLDTRGVAIFYSPEFRNSNVEVEKQTDDLFRNELGNLFAGPSWGFEIYDLGNLLPGNEIKDTYFAIAQVVEELVKKDIIPILVGGSQDLTVAIYKAYQKLEQTVNLVSIDSKFDLGSPDDALSHDGFLSPILMQKPCYLFNHSVIGIQMPFVKQSEIDLFEKLYFDTCRLGEFNKDFTVAEPLLRNADCMSLDLQAIRSSDFHGANYQSPNGFYADQICQIVKYAGISDKLTSLGIFNLFPEDLSAASKGLVAQIIWYFLDGISQRKGDFPIGSRKEYMKFIVSMESSDDDLIFYKSNKSERWWIEIPYPQRNNLKYERHLMVPCNYSDYQLAMSGDIPDIWWKTYQKLI
jgi:formiminoglutamase